MRFKLNQGEKILSIANSGLSILVVLLTNLYKPELFDYAIFFAIVLISLTIIILAVKIAKQSKKISNLENSQRLIELDLSKKEEQIALLERLMNVPFFKKWNLLYTFMWRRSISCLNNPVNLFVIHVTRTLTGNGKLKDNNVSYVFSGECVEKIKTFSFCLAGLGSVPLEKIKFNVKDLTIGKDLEYSVLRNSYDSDMKYVEIYFREPKIVGDIFEIELKWQWPKTAFAMTDYFSMPNIYSVATKRIILDFFPTDDMNLTTVDTYKFGLNDVEPHKIEHLYRNKDGYYRAVIDNPEKNADYITYYE